MLTVRTFRRFQLSLILAWLCPFVVLGGCSETSLVGGQFLSVPVTTSVAGKTYSYDAKTAGIEPGVRVYTLVTSPAGMTVDSFGRVRWSPDFSDLGQTSVTLHATDGDNAAAQSWQIRVHQDIQMGVSYSPRGHTGSTGEADVLAFFAESKDFGKLVGYSGAWRDSKALSGAAPDFATAAMVDAAAQGIIPVIGFSWAAPDGTPNLESSGNADNSWTNADTRADFLMMVESFAGTHKPRYLYLGYEVNTWSLANPGDWAAWLSQLEECAIAIKAASPGTFLFTVFQFERMAGLGDNQSWADAPQWNLVADLETGGFLDGIGFTTYPHFHYDAPSLVPLNYYSVIEANWTGKILFPEIGWTAVADGLFPGSETQQEQWTTNFFGQIEGLPVELAQWLYLHDFDGQGSTPGYMDIGFRNNLGTVTRPSEASWKAAVLARQRP